MSTPSKDKGDRAERALVDHLQTHGFPNARRGKAGGEADLGDIFGVIDRDGDLWCVQVADRKWRGHGEVVAKAVEAEQQAARLGAPMWCLVAKRAGCADVGDWFVWLPAWSVCGGWDRSRPDGWADLACVTVRTWLALHAPTGQAAA